MSRREELAWAAGFFDGEGSSHITKGDARHRVDIRASVGQSNLEVLQRFHAAVSDIGSIYGPYHSTRRSNVLHWNWQANGHQRAQAAVAMLWPWLSTPKRDQFSAVMENWRAYQLKHSYKQGYPRWRKSYA